MESIDRNKAIQDYNPTNFSSKENFDDNKGGFHWSKPRHASSKNSTLVSDKKTKDLDLESSDKNTSNDQGDMVQRQNGTDNEMDEKKQVSTGENKPKTLHDPSISVSDFQINNSSSFNENSSSNNSDSTSLGKSSDSEAKSEDEEKSKSQSQAAMQDGLEKKSAEEIKKVEDKENSGFNQNNKNDNQSVSEIEDSNKKTEENKVNNTKEKSDSASTVLDKRNDEETSTPKSKSEISLNNLDEDSKTAKDQDLEETKGKNNTTKKSSLKGNGKNDKKKTPDKATTESDDDPKDKSPKKGKKSSTKKPRPLVNRSEENAGNMEKTTSKTTLQVEANKIEKKNSTLNNLSASESSNKTNDFIKSKDISGKTIEIMDVTTTTKSSHSERSSRSVGLKQESADEGELKVRLEPSEEKDNSESRSILRLFPLPLALQCLCLFQVSLRRL